MFRPSKGFVFTFVISPSHFAVGTMRRGGLPLSSSQMYVSTAFDGLLVVELKFQVQIPLMPSFYYLLNIEPKAPSQMCSRRVSRPHALSKLSALIRSDHQNSESLPHQDPCALELRLSGVNAPEAGAPSGPPRFCLRPCCRFPGLHVSPFRDLCLAHNRSSPTPTDLYEETEDPNAACTKPHDSEAACHRSGSYQDSHVTDDVSAWLAGN